jgi:hypothetical protein
MYVSYQVLRILAGDRMTAAEQREADEQQGRIVAGLSQSRRRLAERTRALARALTPAGHRSAIFRKVGRPVSAPAATDSTAMLSQDARNGRPTQHRRSAPTGARR